MTPPRRLEAVYELTVVGGLGPALRAMFEPATTMSCELQTIICVRGHDGEDLVDILHLLGALDLDVATIHAVG